jgi:CCR4-NOT complex subunit CAF16
MLKSALIVHPVPSVRQAHCAVVPVAMDMPIVHMLGTAVLLAQITVDMDVLGRLDLLRFFKQECDERSCTIVYATHIFDGLADWMTHLLFVSDGHVAKAGAVEDFPELKDQKVLHLASKWLRNERDRLRAQPKAKPAARSQNDVLGSRQMAFFR